MPFVENSGGVGGSGAVTSVTATDTSIVVAGTAAAPTIATGTLDAIAAAHPAAAAWSNNAKKITGLANGAAAQDAAAFGQIPTALPPNGAAGGVLAGTYPNPSMGTTLSRDQLARNSQGVISESFTRIMVTNAAATASQTVYGMILGLRAGDSVTGVAMISSQAAAGTSPTTGRVGIADSTGKILALSGNVNAPANWPLGSVLLPFAAPYVVLTDGGYYACVVVNGTWGTTQVSLGKAGSGATVIVSATTGGAVPTFSWAAQTDLPAVNSSLTLTTVLSVPFWMAFYGTPVA